MRNAGYTLIELLVVISIIVLFSGLSLAYYNQFNSRNQLDSQTQQLVDVLNLARSKALAGENFNAASCQGNNQFWGYQFDRINASSYRVEFCCGGTDDNAGRCPNASNQANVVQSYSISPFTISPLGTNPILFKLKSAGTNFTAPITIQVSDPSNNSKSITICPIGTIAEGTSC